MVGDVGPWKSGAVKSAGKFIWPITLNELMVSKSWVDCCDVELVG